MNSLNSLIIEGNLVKDCVLSESNGFKVAKFTVAVNRSYKNAANEFVDEVSFFDCEGYGVLADVLSKNCLKGRGVRLVGRLKQNRWKDANGKAQSKIIVVTEHCEFKPQKAQNSTIEQTEEQNEEVCF